MKENEEPFVIRAYTKAELVHLYIPSLYLKGALKVMRRWSATAFPDPSFASAARRFFS